MIDPVRVVVAMVLAIGCGRIDFGAVQDATTEPPMVTTIQTLAPGYVMAASASIDASLDGNHLVVAAVYWNSVQALTVTDTAALGWVALDGLVTAPCPAGHGPAGVQLWYAITTVPVTTTVTVTQPTGTQALGMYLVEYDGVSTTNPIDTAATLAAPTTSNAMESAPLQTIYGDLVVALFANPNLNGTMVPGADWTGRASDFLFYSLIEDGLRTPGTIVATASLPATVSDSCWAVAAAAFRGR